jgi:hypothetical protein
MKQEQIQQLLNRYLDGLTTNQEERQLRHYFRKTQIVPPEWRPYQVLFAWEQREDQKKRSSRRNYMKYGIAASLTALILVGAGLTANLLTTQHSTLNTQQNYAVIDGQLITDTELIMQEAEQALVMVSATDDETFDALNNIQL